MKKSTKILALILTVSILSLSSVASFADDSTPANPAPGESLQMQSYYNSFTGIIKEINEETDGIKTVYLESKDGKQAYFNLTKDTYYVNDVKIAKDMEITGYYKAGDVMIMIYPPRYSIEIVTPVITDTNIKADKFGTDLISADGMLKLNLSEDTEIVWENGTQVYWFVKPTLEQIAGVLQNRRLIVFYDSMTKSIPAQTTPTKIIVLSQQESDIDVSGLPIVVNGNVVTAPSAFSSENGNVMVPIRSIAEALGYEITWNESSQNIMVGSDVSLKINEDSYTSGENTVNLGASPILKDNCTYVPLSFFNGVLGAVNANVSDNQIIIDAAKSE